MAEQEKEILEEEQNTENTPETEEADKKNAEQTAEGKPEAADPEKDGASEDGEKKLFGKNKKRIKGRQERGSLQAEDRGAGGQGKTPDGGI